MYVTHLECSRCGSTHGWEGRQQVCDCGAPLLVRYDGKGIRESIKKEDLARRPKSLWRYREMLPLLDERNRVTLGEGMTPLIPLDRLGSELGMNDLWMKDEGLLPTGTFKARGAAVGVSRARELGVKVLAMPTNGNAGGAWAAYCAAAGIRSVIVMPKEAPAINRKECAVLGASLYLVDGLISDAGRIVARAVADRGWYDASTLREPYRIEGKKTMGLELAEQCGWEAPDVVLYPTGGGVGLIGIYKAFEELRALGWVDEKMPRLVAVQSTGCAPIVKAWEEGREESAFWEDSRTVAFGINVPKALGDFLVLKALYETGGCAVAVNDEEILSAQRTLAQKEGMFVCPEGAATLSAAIRLARSGWIQAGEKVVLLNTGTGLKYPDTVACLPPLLGPGDPLPRL